MATRLPASQRTREELAALIEGHLSTASGKDELVKLATRLIVEEALEGEAGDTIGRDYYEHGAKNLLVVSGYCPYTWPVRSPMKFRIEQISPCPETKAQRSGCL
jgi:hypothetical protein